MKVRHAQRSGDKIELQMTPMIDIVFQLLVFFIMTFKIVAPEGDFNIRMPLAAPSEGKLDELLIPPIKVRLTATGTGHLAAIRMNEKNLGRNFNGLNMEIRQIIGDSSMPGHASDVEVEIDADYGLHFEFVMDAITAVSGYVGEDNRIITVSEKIKFASPRPPQ